MYVCMYVCLCCFTKAIVYSTSIYLLLRRRCCLCDFTRALFGTFGRICGWFSLHTLPTNVWIVVVCLDGLIACFCHKLTYNQLGGYDHSVLDTFVQLTEGRSARDQPKQPPAKKGCMYVCMYVGMWVCRYVGM